MGNAIKFPEAPSITWGGEAYYIENQLNPVPLPKSKAASPEGLEASGASNAAVAGSLHSPSSSALNLSVAFKNEFHGGRVYTLANENFSKHLALKIYLKYYSVEVINWLLLRRELLIKLSGAPYIVPLYKCYQDEDRCYILTPFFPGGDLAHYLDNGFAFTYKVARSAIATIVIALQHLHVQGIVHEDVRPENIFIDAGGACHLSMTKTSLWLLSPSFPIPKLVIDYTSPEVLRGEKPTPASDWWSFGALFAHMVQGHPPFEAPNMKLLKRQIFTAEPTLDYSIPKGLREVLSNLLTKDPALRLSSAAKVIRHPFFGKVDWDAVRSHAYESLFEPTREGIDLTPARNPDGELEFEEIPDKLDPTKQAAFGKWDWFPKRKHFSSSSDWSAALQTIEQDHLLLSNPVTLSQSGCPLESTVDGVGRVIFALEELPVGKSFQTLSGNKLSRTDQNTCVLYVPRRRETRFEIHFQPHATSSSSSSSSSSPTSNDSQSLDSPASSTTTALSPTSSSSSCALSPDPVSSS